MLTGMRRSMGKNALQKLLTNLVVFAVVCIVYQMVALAIIEGVEYVKK
jgi:hypothetical protein